MDETNSYYSVGMNDFLYAKAGFGFAKDLPNYNGVVSGCAQSAKKFMKAVIEIGFDTDDGDNYINTNQDDAREAQRVKSL